MFSCKFCETFKNSYFEERLWTTVLVSHGYIPNQFPIWILELSRLEKCPYSEFFWSVFRTNAGKYEPELRIRTLFTQCLPQMNLWHISGQFAFHIKTSHLFCHSKPMIGFYMKRNIGLKCVNRPVLDISKATIGGIP